VTRRRGTWNRWLLPTPGHTHLVQLDALRAIAVLLVLVWHTSDTAARGAPLGLWGVDLFFVLSGFLITGILVDAADGTDSWGTVIRSFYARRFLRIFPLFYFALVVGALLAVPGVRVGFWWYAAYLANFYFIFHGWAGYAAHLWSLAVEEQFYVFAPFVLLVTPRRLLPRVMYAAIGLAVAYRVGAGLAGWSRRGVILPPIASWDCLGIGALLAITRRSGTLDWLRWTLPVGLPLLALDVVLTVARQGGNASRALFDLQFAIEGTAVALVGVWFVARAADGFGGLTGRFLTSAPLVYLGSISYGIYVYHHFLLYPAARWNVAGRVGELGYTLVIAAASILVAAASWHLFERPVNTLKRHFPYEGRNADRAASGTGSTT
jgi:peptidoglycan/LPS O-acetylase OafA/YrhL